MKLFLLLSLSSLAVVTGKASGFADAAAFRHPEAVYSPGYFWMWNAPLERETLDRQLDEMAANGLRAVCPHPFPKSFRPSACHSEMSPDYLTEGHLQAFAGTVDKAKSLGLHVWLYDEGGWPSGSACRQVAQSDAEGRFCVRYLARDERTGALELKVEPHGGEWGFVPSVIEPGAAERFLQLTHEAYAKVCGQEFGKTVRFAFTDEPTRPPARKGKLPWASDFDAQFRRRKGYDIRPLADALFSGSARTDEAATQARIDYEDVMSQLFVERYLLKVRDWCRAHGLASGGHLNGEDVPEKSVEYAHGSLLRGLRAMDVPGVDTIWRQLFPKTGPACGRVAPFPRYAASAAHQNGGSVVLSESFAIYGDSLTPDQMKWIADCQMVRGVTSFVFAYYSMSTAGQWMILFEPHSGPVQPYWDFMEPYFRYVHRMCALLAKGRPGAEIAVVFDTRDFWAGGEDGRRATKAHYDVSSALDGMNCDFDFIDDDQVSEAVFSDGRLTVGKMSYSTVVLPASRRLLPAARAKLEAFRRAGGRVLGPDDVGQAPRTARLSGAGAEDIRVLKRVDGDEVLYFLVNEAMAPRSVKVAFDEGVSNVRLANPQMGDFSAVAAGKDGFAWQFPPAGSAAFVVGARGAAAERVPTCAGAPRTVDGWTARKTVEHVPGKTDFEVKPATDAAFVPIALGDWRKTFGDRFCGRVQYRATFDVKSSGRVRIDLGDVKGAARVSLNGRVVDTFFFGPAAAEAEAVRGRNVLDVEVANALCNALFSETVRDRIARDFPPLTMYDPMQRRFDREFNESGLYGPVTVRRIDVEEGSESEKVRNCSLRLVGPHR